MANPLNDGLSKPDQFDDQSIDSAEEKIIGLGSPSGYGQIVQTGQFVLGAGSAATVAFGTAFKGTPNVVCSAFGANGLGWIGASGPSTTGFTAIGTVASSSGTYIAIGSGAF